jgi:hypothetical protein
MAATSWSATAAACGSRAARRCSTRPARSRPARSTAARGSSPRATAATGCTGPLARKHQLSGGYIRNACLRAAYLAASDGTALGDGHLQRAVALEYQRAGKLADGRLE